MQTAIIKIKSIILMYIALTDFITPKNTT